jgi:nifR3 family TIM-barrel protein
MRKSFWDNLPQPFFILGPMYDVTDVAFRRVVNFCGKPDVFFTEFVSADGLASVGRDHLMHMLRLDKEEKPVVAQIFGAQPENFFKAAQLIQSLGFDGIDINMGCPDKNIIKGGSCAALFRTPKLAQEIIQATKDGAGELPVSVKIRIGDTKVDWQDWVAALLQAGPAVISVHLRTRKEMSKVPAHWELMPDIVKFIHERTTPETRPLIVGNGDVMNLKEGREKVATTGCDGIMIGRGIFSNPWLFKGEEFAGHTLAEKLDLLLKHTEWFEQEFAGKKAPQVLKRFYKVYVNGFQGAAELREKLYQAATPEEIKSIIRAVK